jgi:Mce-associated membrane protein
LTPTSIVIQKEDLIVVLTADQDAATDAKLEDDCDEVTSAEIAEAPSSDSTPTADSVDGRRIRWRRIPRAGATLLVVVFVVMLAVTGVLGWTLWKRHTLTANGEAAQQTAINYARILTSIDSANVDRNFADVLNGATGDFKDTYTKASVQLRELLIDNKATANGVVVASAIQSETDDQVVVLLMVDQTVTNAVRPDSRVDRSRMKMTMKKVGGRWLASKVELP